MKNHPHSPKPKSPALAPDEYKRRRRERRMRRTVHSESGIQSWAEQHGFALRVLNGGHHWIFEKPGVFAEWWPSSAKLALNHDYIHTLHAPHWSGVVVVLARSLGSETNKCY